MNPTKKRMPFQAGPVAPAPLAPPALPQTMPSPPTNMGISGLMPRRKPSVAMPRQTAGLSTTRTNLSNVRADSLPRTKRGSR